MDSCIKHPHESGVALCRRCGGSWCADCLVYSFGPKKPPYCMGCAMVAGGVRSAADRPAMGRRELKALQKAAKAEAKAAAKVAKKAPKDPVDEGVAAMADTPAPKPESFDWSTPLWEDDRQPTLAD
jgi:hypothetical protein